MRTRSRAKNRRGVLLLLLLGLLAMFGVVAITFVLITGQYRRAASLGRTGESPLEEEQELLDNAFKQLVRGDKKSMMGCLSLLEDMYGNRTFGAPDAAGNATPQGIMVNKPNTTFVRLVAPGTAGGRWRGQILEFTAAMVDPANVQNTAYMPDPYRYVGQVLTFLDGPARHQSVPIIGYRIDTINNQALLQAVAPDVSPEDLMENYFIRGARCRFIINGSAFSGTGFGLKTLSAGAGDPVPDTLEGLLEKTTNDGNASTTTDIIATANTGLTLYPEIALMPNAPEGREPAGGANEDYDAADLQNPHLASVLRDGTVPSPSFHRPEIVRYWINRIKTVAGEDPSNPNQFAVLAQKYLSAPVDKLACRIIFRPLPKYHPNFTGSNPAYQLALGHYASGFNPLWSGIRLEQDADSSGIVEPAEYRWDWDVDSDGDGTPDSVWVDLGMPVRSDADGRLYKPLFAIFCTDLDGRLNVNAHGAHMHRDPSFTSVVDPNIPAFAPPGMMSMGGMFAFAGGAPLALPRGLGYAPFEISLAPLFSSPLDYQAVIANRYYSYVPATASAEYLPGTANADDFLSWNMWSQYGGAYWNMAAAGNAGSYGSPPDFDGDMAVGLDPGGRPIFIRAAIGDHVDDPGELDLAGSASVDSPYTPAELEPILRPYDTDSASLTSRLLPPTLTASSNLVAYRNLLTTDSWDVPVPNLSVPEDIVRRLIAEINGTGATAPVPAVKTWLVGLYPPRHMSDVLALKAYFEYRVRDTSGGGLAARQTNAMAHARQIAAAASQVLSWDLMTGLKMDVNRPFGNGQDQAIDYDGDSIPDTINNVVDEPGRIVRNTSSPYALKLDTGFMGPPRFFGFPGESADGSETTLLKDRSGALIPNIGFNHVDGFDVNGDGTVDQIDKALVRQWYARHLYVLMMLLADERSFYGTNKTDPTDPQDGFRVYSQAEDERKARAIAQWAINVVDFRDRDSIMTPFEYDIYPFTNPVAAAGPPQVFDNNGINNTWDVDGIIEPNPDNPDLLPPSGTAPYIDDGQPYRGLVWGCERPELLITETLATHDFRLQDLDTDNGDAKTTTDPTNPDGDYDNLKRPEGSLFIELYNPWTNLEPAPAELYSSMTGGGVDLARTVPDRPDPSQPGLAVNWPVWRMIFVPGDNTMAALDPDDPENWPRNGGTLVAERSLYFANPTGAISLTVPPQETAKPLTGNDANHGTEQFYPDVAVGVIPPGGYAVIGPGLPQAAVSGSGTDYVTYFGKRSSDPGDGQTQEPTDANQTRQIRLNVGGANPAESPVKANTNPQLEPQTDQIRNVVSIVVDEPNRLNLTEPDGGYPDTITNATFDSNSTRMYLTAVPGGSPMASDTPLDAGRTDRIGTNHLNPADPPTVQARVSIAHLQRLANPLQPWHPELNPYLTVDSSPIDLIPFNGWDNMPSGQPNPNHFASHQRGETNTTDDGTNNLWIQRLGLKTIDTTANQLGDDHYFDEIMSHSIGYVSSRLPLNDPLPFGPPRTTAPYVGDPAGGPFPWLAWNNRPFVSQLELLSVPVASSSRLLNANIGAGSPEPNYTFFAMVEPNLSNYSPYDGIAMSPTQEGGFAHQLNFFHSRAYATGAGAGMPEFHRVLDYTFVPSRFVGNTLSGNPTAFSVVSPSHLFYPPFNSISYYREPGRINLNTLSDPLVWQGLTNGSPVVSNNLAQAFTWFTDNRRGFALGANGVDINNQFPTRMTRPFRTFAGRYLVPETQVTPNLQAQVGREVGSGMLREHPSVANHPLFEEANLGGAATNSQRNPFFQYRGLQRLGNLATSRSNVYAIWITLGKFEVQPIAYRPNDNTSKTYQLTPAEFSLIYGDGYELGQELGSDIGRVERNRSFYIFDRSIPMGFVRGEDLNIEKGIRLKRSIK